MAGEIKQVIMQIISRIPRGKVVYYGQVAQIASMEMGRPLTAQLVGWTLSGMTEDESNKYPWQRIVAKTGDISTLKLGPRGLRQISLLQDEGVEVSDDKIDMSLYGWRFENTAK